MTGTSRICSCKNFISGPPSSSDSIPYNVSSSSSNLDTTNSSDPDIQNLVRTGAPVTTTTAKPTTTAKTTTTSIALVNYELLRFFRSLGEYFFVALLALLMWSLQNVGRIVAAF